LKLIAKTIAINKISTIFAHLVMERTSEKDEKKHQKGLVV